VQTIIELLQQHASNNPDGLCVHLFSKRKKQAALNWSQLLGAAQRAAAFFKANGIGHRDAVALMGGHDLDFYGVWLGAVWVGAVPCVLPDPSVRVDRGIYWSRLEMMLGFAGVKFLALGSSITELGSTWTKQIPHSWYQQITASGEPIPEPYPAAADDPLLLQHSAGTTGTPKSVLLTHGMVERQVDALMSRSGRGSDEIIASWLPLYHDLGMICSFLTPLYAGVPVIWLSTFEWVANPSLLLDAIQEHRATRAMFPNFTFGFLASVPETESFDLSSLRTIYSGGEPVTESAVRAFLKRYSSSNFSTDMFHVGYGMAESVAVVTQTGPECPPKFTYIDKEEWSQRHHAVRVDPSKGECVAHVSCGLPLKGCRVRIVDERGKPLPLRQAGRVLVKTPFLFSGYFGRDDLNQNLFDEEGFYDSGDLGYTDEDGHVYITGRLKDLVIIGGRNVYPHDVEDVVNTVRGVYPGRAVCFGIPLARMGTEGLVVLFESEEQEDAWQELRELVRQTVTSSYDVDVFDVRCVPRTALRKSTAGKLARAGNRTWYLEGRFGEPPKAALGG
jgi:fatty-acyl-CoA synthase